MLPWKVNGITFRIILKFFMGLIARSKWIRTKAIVYKSLTSAFVNWLLSTRKSGLFRFLFNCFSYSAIVKPRSYITLSFEWQNLPSKISDFQTIKTFHLKYLPFEFFLYLFLYRIFSFFYLTLTNKCNASRWSYPS